MRQSITNESMKKIDEIEAERNIIKRKEIGNKNFKSILENFNQLNNKDG